MKIVIEVSFAIVWFREENNKGCSKKEFFAQSGRILSKVLDRMKLLHKPYESVLLVLKD